MTGSVHPIPEGAQVVTPMLAYEDAAAAIRFYIEAFGATEIHRLTDSAGKIAHSEISIGAGRLMIADKAPGFNRTVSELGGSTVLLHLYVEDVDTVFERAVAAGAAAERPVEDQFYGQRSGRLADPFGYVWIVSSRIEQVSDEEVMRRFAALTG